MTQGASMHVRVRLPTRILYAGDAGHVFAVAENGAFGLLPNHADYVASLVASVLILRKETGEELFFGIDQGLLVKRGPEVDIAVRRGVRGDSLDTLSETVATVFTEVDEAERTARTALSRLEVGIVRQLSELRKPV
ncbi:MAG: F0F1 ATP synthase subunit epsilon [Ottowia sp.]|nr:F0F1 ATP synthase subunit epsilon [Ottowia sp.]